MLLPRLFPMHRRNQLIALFDVGSGSVGGALLHLKHGEKPRLLCTIRNPIVFQAKRDDSRLFLSMLDALRDTAKELDKQCAYRAAEGDPSKVMAAHIVLASSWYVSRTHLVKLERDETFAITERFLDTMMNEAKAHFQVPEYAVQNRTTPLVNLEETVIQTILNGYPTEDPIGKRAKRLDAAIYLSRMEDQLRDRVQEAIVKHFNDIPITFHSFLLTAYRAACLAHPQDNDVLLIDIGGETTDIGLVHDGVLLESVSFPWGRNYVLREIAGKLGTIPEEAHTLLRMSDSQKEQKYDQRTRLAQSAVATTWLAALGEACKTLTVESKLPSRILLTTLTDLAPWFARHIGGEFGKQYTFTHEPFTVEIFGAADVAGAYLLAANTSHDPFLALEAIALNQLQFPA